VPHRGNSIGVPLLKWGTTSVYLTQYRLLVLCHYVHCCLLHSLKYLYTTNCTVLVSVSLGPLLSSTDCPLPLNLTMYRLLVLRQYAHCCLRQSNHCLSKSGYNVFGSVSLCPVFSSIFCPCSVYKHSTVSWFSVTMSTAVFDSLPTVCVYITLYRL